MWVNFGSLYALRCVVYFKRLLLILSQNRPICDKSLSENSFLIFDLFILGFHIVDSMIGIMQTTSAEDNSDCAYMVCLKSKSESSSL